MTESYFSRARLRRDASVAALVPLLAPTRRGGMAAASHALVWSLFADCPDRKRDFLYREADRGILYILSMRPPADRHALFDLDTKCFAPQLAIGDRLGFSLRANPVVRRRRVEAENSAKDDVVMHALHRLAPGIERREARSRLIDEAGRVWLDRIASRGGFTVEQVTVDGYRQHRIARGAGERRIQFASLDFQGTLSVADPDRFLAAIGQGFGAARAFGCGLMLIRRI